MEVAFLLFYHANSQNNHQFEL